MSAFSNWNGPDCGHGPSLPQIQTLESLIVEVGKLRQTIQSIYNDFDAHTHDDLLPLHTAIQNKIQAIWDALANYAKSADTNAALAAKADKIVVDTALANKADKSTTYTKDETYTKTDVDTKFAGLVDFNKLNDTFKTFDTYWQTFILDFNKSLAINSSDYLKLLKPLEALAIHCEQIKASYYIEFTRWSRINAPIYVVNGRGEQACVLGMLSENWNIDVPAMAEPAKSGRFFVKFDDSELFNAICDVSVTRDKDGLKYNGVINVLCAKTSTRKRWPADTEKHAPIRFSLYRATVKGKTHYYIGVVIEEGSVTVQTIGALAGCNFYCAGINVLPLENSMHPDGVLHEISAIEVLEDAELVYSGAVAVSSLRSNLLLDRNGHQVFKVTEPGEDEAFPKGAVHIGTPNSNGENGEHTLVLHSASRRPMFESEVINGDQQIALLEDISSATFDIGIFDFFVPFSSELPYSSTIQIGSHAEDVYTFPEGQVLRAIRIPWTDFSPWDGANPRKPPEDAAEIWEGTVTAAGTIGWNKISDDGPEYYPDPARQEAWQFDAIWFKDDGQGPDPADTFYHQASFVWSPYANPEVVKYALRTVNLVLENYYNKQQTDELLDQVDLIDGVQPDWLADDGIIPNPRINGVPNMVPDPRFIQNKPLLGANFMDAGDFTGPVVPIDHMLDAGDYTKAPEGPVPASSTLWGNQYHNVMMRIWRGAKEFMPDASKNTGFTLKWCTNTKQLYIDSGDPALGNILLSGAGNDTSLFIQQINAIADGADPLNIPIQKHESVFDEATGIQTITPYTFNIKIDEPKNYDDEPPHLTFAFNSDPSNHDVLAEVTFKIDVSDKLTTEMLLKFSSLVMQELSADPDANKDFNIRTYSVTLSDGPYDPKLVETGTKITSTANVDGARTMTFERTSFDPNTGSQTITLESPRMAALENRANTDEALIADLRTEVDALNDETIQEITSSDGSIDIGAKADNTIDIKLTQQLQDEIAAAVFDGSSNDGLILVSKPGDPHELVVDVKPNEFVLDITSDTDVIQVQDDGNEPGREREHRLLHFDPGRLVITYDLSAIDDGDPITNGAELKAALDKIVFNIELR